MPANRKPPASPLDRLSAEIASCDSCPRLRSHCRKIASVKRAAYSGETYWGRPIPGFGDPKARLMVVGLAPGAHGANRTGRVFTGDRSGEWLYRALHRAGFASQPLSRDPCDGLELRDAYVSCVVKCAPPANKPSPAELRRCSPYLERELAAMPGLRVFLALGQIALQGLWPHLAPGRSRPRFAHGARAELAPGRWLLMSYHPSQQNTFTGRLTEPMLDSVFTMARDLLGSG